VGPVGFTNGLFLDQITRDPVWYVSWVATVVVSVVLHELGHGYAALAQGDGTPRWSGHMTLDPLVHMGPLSLVALFLFGFAWGAMPVDPTRFRGRYGEALVSLAGPAVNLLLALLGLTALGLWLGAAGPPEGGLAGNLVRFLYAFGTANVVLGLLNLLPVPPLDGSGVLSNLSRPYARWVRDPDNHGLFTALLWGVFLGAGYVLFPFADRVAMAWVRLLAG
jgi:Zn-dependent protease